MDRTEIKELTEADAVFLINTHLHSRHFISTTWHTEDWSKHWVGSTTSFQDEQTKT